MFSFWPETVELVVELYVYTEPISQPNTSAIFLQKKNKLTTKTANQAEIVNYCEYS